MSTFINSDDHPTLHWWAETAEFAATSSVLSAGFGYILNVSKVVHLTHPLQGGIYGAVAAVVIRLALELQGEGADKESLKYKALDTLALVAPIVVGTGVTYAAGFPMSYAAGVCLFPAVVVAKLALDRFMED